MLSGAVKSNEVVTPEKLRVQKVLDLVANGTPIQEAIRESGADRKMFARVEVKEAIEAFLSAGNFTADVVRATLRNARFAAFVQLMSEGMTENNLGKLKIALELSDQIGSDPNIGLNTPPKVEVNLEFGSLTDLMDKVKKEEIIDAEIEDTTAGN